MVRRGARWAGKAGLGLRFFGQSTLFLGQFLVEGCQPSQDCGLFLLFLLGHSRCRGGHLPIPIIDRFSGGGGGIESTGGSHCSRRNKLDPDFISALDIEVDM